MGDEAKTIAAAKRLDVANLRRQVDGLLHDLHAATEERDVARKARVQIADERDRLRAEVERLRADLAKTKAKLERVTKAARENHGEAWVRAIEAALVAIDDEDGAG